MEDLQSWWEVPTIAHFCYVFRAAFNLFHFEIEELEAALLQQQNDGEQPCATVEQLAMRLLQGCNLRKPVSVENWEEILCTRLQRTPAIAKRHQYLLNGNKTFSTLDLKEKVELLLSLCEMRLDGDDVAEATKDLEGCSLRIEPLGTDSEENTYWYFFGTRLYKEDLKLVKELTKPRRGPKPKQKNLTVNGCGRNLSGSRRSSRAVNKTSDSVSSTAWSIVCWTVDDWESLCSSLRKSSVTSDRSLSKKIHRDYMPMLQEVIAEQERIRKKRLVEIMPRRASVRIDLHKQQLEQARQKRVAEEEEVKRKRELEENAKQIAEKTRAAEERAKRAKLRELKLQYSDNSNSSTMFDTQKQQYSHNYLASEDEVSVNSDSGAAPSEALKVAMEGEEDSASDSESLSEDEDSESDELYSPTKKVPKQKFSYQTNKLSKKIKIMRNQVVKKAGNNRGSDSTNHRNFGQFDGLKLESPGVKASILYHSFKTYSTPKTYPNKTELNGELQTSVPTVSTIPTVISFDILRDSGKTTNSNDV